MKKILLFLFISLVIFLPSLSLANNDDSPVTSTPLSGLKEIQSQVGSEYMPAVDPILWIVRAFNYILTFLGVIFIIMIIYGGYTWMTAAGNEEKVKKGKTILQTAIIGLAIIILVRVIYLFLEDKIKVFSSK